MTERRPPRVFISYRHEPESPEHAGRVLALAERLGDGGIDAVLDQFELSPPEGWPTWSEREIRRADFVLMVCTEAYHRCIEDEEPPGAGHGVLWEARIIRQLLYDAGSSTTTLIPVLFANGSADHIPIVVKSATRYVVDTAQGYEDLYRQLTNQPKAKKRELGRLRKLPERARQWREQPLDEANAAIPPTEDLGELPSYPIPKNANEPTAILAAWMALEALSLRKTYRRPEDLVRGDRRLADLSAGRVPWGTAEHSRPKKRLFYEVILGSILMEKATEDLVKKFGKDEERSLRDREKAIIGAVLVDKDGIVVEENGIAVSSFAWALPLSLKLKLGALSVWPKIEPKIIERLDGILRRVDSDGKPVPLDLLTIDKAHRWLVAQFGLPHHLVEPPTFALSVYHHFKAKNPPEASLLNSYFLGDLARGAALAHQHDAPTGMRRYLGIEKPQQTFDLLADTATLEEAVAPEMMPAARWPTPGGHPLVMLQQAAVNLAISELAGGEGVVAVNGPPGTGKTTLLRDVVAACVLDRALAMAAFDDPEKAFTASGEKMSAGGKAAFHLYALDPSLKGSEILVASYNNKAVENVSKELPAAKAIGRTTDELSYFKCISDLVHGPRNTADDDDDDGEDDDVAPDPVETWGLIAGRPGQQEELQCLPGILLVA